MCVYVCACRVKIRSEVHQLIQKTKSYETQLYTLQVEKKETEDICTGFQMTTEQTLLSFDQLKEKSDKDSKELLEQRMKISSYMSRIERLRAENSELRTANEKMAGDVNVLEMEKKRLEKNIKTVQDGILAVKLAVSVCVFVCLCVCV